MKRKIIETADGSKTIFLPEWNEYYHSKHGAIQETKHVFINNGLHYCIENFGKEISILEIGFGTGLNAFLTILETQKLNLDVNYTGIEAYPVLDDEFSALNYTSNKSEERLFDAMHTEAWEIKSKFFNNFSLLKQKKSFSEIEDKNLYDLIYFDAFGVRVQPELWTEAIFEKMFKALKSKGILVTYAAAGSVRRAMQTVGFTVEKLPGPPGKREMLRAYKNL